MKDLSDQIFIKHIIMNIKHQLTITKFKLSLLLLVFSLAGCGDSNDESASSETPSETPNPPTPLLETTAALTPLANQPLIWLHPTDTALSIILGTHQEAIETYNLQGNQLQVLPTDHLKALDFRYNFPLNGQLRTLLMAIDAASQLQLYTIIPDTLQLQALPQPQLTPPSAPKNLCLYQSAHTGKFSLYLIDNQGLVQQWELFQTAEGKISANLMRQWEGGGDVCVADDQLSYLYLAKAQQLFKYQAEPQAGTEAQLIDTAPNAISHLSLYYTSEKNGYLLASQPQANNFLVYQQQDNHLLGSFTIIANDNIDAVDNSIGIAVTNVALSPSFANGLLVAQDSENTEPTANNNYKLVPWEQIAQFLNLTTDTSLNPRKIATYHIRQVFATVETEPVSVGGDAADDIAIWIHPLDPSLSTIISTQKQGALIVYDLNGQELQTLPDGRMNNVDLRDDFPLRAQTITLVAASNRTDNNIALYQVNATTRQLEPLVYTETVGLDDEIYGLCMYHNSSTHQYYIFINDKKGTVEQWEIFANTQGEITGQPVRRFEVGSQTEGCVADDVHGIFYIGEEDVGIWKYGANPTDGETRTSVDTTNLGGHLTADVEGLTIYDAGDGQGYLIASNQGNHSFTVYQRTGNNQFLGTFQIIADEQSGIDGATDTDGIDVTSVSLGDSFPHGVFIAQDGQNLNPPAAQNFKLVPWENIANAFGF
jgi:3-phytase